MKNKNQLEKMVPIRLTMFAWIPIIIWFFLPSLWWTIIIKLLIIIWEIVVFKAAFSSIWYKYEHLGAFISMNVLWFILLLITKSNWLSYIFGFLIVIGFATQFKQIDDINKTIK
mgnify:FL=1